MKYLRTLRMAAIGTAWYALPALARAACAAGQICNPVKEQTLAQFVADAMHAFVILMLPVVACAFVASGFYFVYARGNPQKIARAKMVFLYVLIGACVIFAAWPLANLIGSTEQQLIVN